MALTDEYKKALNTVMVLLGDIDQRLTSIEARVKEGGQKPEKKMRNFEFHFQVPADSHEFRMLKEAFHAQQDEARCAWIGTEEEESKLLRIVNMEGVERNDGIAKYFVFTLRRDEER